MHFCNVSKLLEAEINANKTLAKCNHFLFLNGKWINPELISFLLFHLTPNIRRILWLWLMCEVMEQVMISYSCSFSKRQWFIHSMRTLNRIGMKKENGFYLFPDSPIPWIWWWITNNCNQHWIPTSFPCHSWAVVVLQLTTHGIQLRLQNTVRLKFQTYSTFLSFPTIIYSTSTMNNWFTILIFSNFLLLPLFVHHFHVSVELFFTIQKLNSMKRFCMRMGYLSWWRRLFKQLLQLYSEKRN